MTKHIENLDDVMINNGTGCKLSHESDELVFGESLVGRRLLEKELLGVAESHVCLKKMKEG